MPRERDIQQRKLNQKIKHLLEPFKQQSFGGIEIAYGDELHLHFFEHRPQEFGYSESEMKGDWILLTSASLWELENHQEVILDTSLFDEQKTVNTLEIRKQFKVLQNQKIQSIDVLETKKGLKTRINFTKGFSFALLPNPKAIDLPIWELFTPTETVFTF